MPQQFSSSQLRAARGLLNWSRPDLAAKTAVSEQTLHRFENDMGEPEVRTQEKIRRVFDEHGIEFIGNDGVRLKNDHIVTLKGENIFFRVLDDVIATLRNIKKPEALFACVVDKLSPPVVVENYRRLRASGIAMRSLVQEGDTYLMGALKEYRHLPTSFFHNNTTIIYGDKFATMILDPETRADIGAIIIRNPHVAAAQRNLFNLIWSNAKAPSKTTAKVRYDSFSTALMSKPASTVARS